MTFVEVLVAIVIASIFLVGIVGAISALLNAARDAERTSEGVRQAAHALGRLSEDAASVATAVTPIGRLLGIDGPLPTGDFIDNDQDGLIDEEVRDGTNTDGGPVVQIHVPVSQTNATLVERPRETAIAEVGDIGVDEDCAFQHDFIRFITTDGIITYQVTTFDGEDNVLVRDFVDLVDPANNSQGPVAFDVLSFSALYYDPNWLINASPTPWATSWDSNAPTGPIAFPPRIQFVVTVFTGDNPLASLAPGAPLPSVTLETQVVLESAIAAYNSQF
jgi:type II secretory pathway pseudopilin PulG